MLTWKILSHSKSSFPCSILGRNIFWESNVFLETLCLSWWAILKTIFSSRKFLIVWIKLYCARFCVQQKTGFVCFQNIEASLDLRPPIDFHLRTEIASRINWENECFADRWVKIDKVDCNFCFWQKLFGFSSFGERQDRRLTPRSQIRPNSVK